MTDGAAERVIGGLRILPPGQTQAVTLLVLVHGWGGNTKSTWGRTPELLFEQFPQAVDVGLFQYQSGIWWLGRKGVEDLGSQLLQDIRSAAEQYGYRQVGIAGHSLGGLVAALAAETLLDCDRPALTALLCMVTPWKGVWAASIAPWFIRQLRDLAPGNKSVREAARRAFDRVSSFVWTEDVHGRQDALVDSLSGGAARPYWTYLGHRGACAAPDRFDEKFFPFRRFAEKASGASTLLYLRVLKADLESWRIRPISPASADELYERQSASPWTAMEVEDPERVSRGDQEALTGPRRRQDEGAASERLDDVLKLLDYDQALVCLTGEGGTGKTTAIAELARRATLRALEAPRVHPIPVALHLNDEPVSVENLSASTILAALRSRCQAGEALANLCDEEASDDFVARMLLLADGLDEADASQVNLVCELSRKAARAAGKAILAGRPEAVIRERSFQVLRLDALDRGRIEGIVRRQLGADAQTFWSWIPAGFDTFLTNPGQLEMTMQLWYGSGYQESSPVTLGELYERALPYWLARGRDPRKPAQTWLPAESFELASRLKALLPTPAFEQLRSFTAGSPASPTIRLGELGLGKGECDALETAGLVERRERGNGGTAWRFASARWREFFASLELRRRAEASKPLNDVARPSWLNVWRIAATSSSDAVLRAAKRSSEVLQVVVAVSAGTSDVSQPMQGMSGHQRRVLVDMLRGTPGRASLNALVALCQDLEGEVRQAAARALRGTTDPAALHALLQLCQDPESDARGAAARALAGTTDPMALAALINLCRDTKRSLRWAAARALTGTTDPATLAALVNLCRDAKGKVRRNAARALEGTTDPMALAALVNLCRDQERKVRTAAAWALEGTRDPTALTTLVDLCRDPDGSVREAAARALGGTTDPTTLAALVNLCRDKERYVRRAAARALRSTTDPATLAALLNLCRDQERNVREASARALRGTRHPTALAVLVSLCRDSDGHVRGAAARALRGTAGPATLAALVDLCRDALSSVRGAAARALTGTMNPAALAALANLCRDSDANVRASAVRALEGTMDPTALAALLNLCRDTTSSVRRAAARALTGTMDPAALAGLVNLCRDQERKVRTAAAWALEGTRDPMALTALVDLCRDPDGSVREAAARALGGRTDPTTLAALVNLCRDKERKVRMAAVWALDSAPPRSQVAQMLLAADLGAEAPAGMRGLLYRRLLADDVPFSEWPEE